MVRTTGITETALYVDDLQRAITFYRELLGVEVIRQDERFSALRLNDQQVLLLFRRGASLSPMPVGSSFVPPHDGAGPMHICFGIEEEDFSLWEEKLERSGIPLESEVRWPTGARSLYFRDPEGHAVELATPGLWQ